MANKILVGVGLTAGAAALGYAAYKYLLPLLFPPVIQQSSNSGAADQSSQNTKSTAGQTQGSGNTSSNPDLANAQKALASGINYSGGPSGVATVPITDSTGSVVSTILVDNTKNTGNTNVLQTSQGPGSTGNVAAAAIIAPPNTTIGYVTANGTPGQASTAVQSSGSSFSGAGEYISSTGAPSFISSQAQFDQQKALGYLK